MKNGYHETDLSQFGLQKSVVLTGMMGVGKTTIGRRLAKRLDVAFFDADIEIEHAAGMSIADYFETFGEADFRQGEQRVIERLLNKPPCVIATGGGAFVNDDSRALIQQLGVSVWLFASIDTLVERTSFRDTRPLLKEGNRHEILTNLYAKREPIYANAHIHVESINGPHYHTVESILAKLVDHPFT